MQQIMPSMSWQGKLSHRNQLNYKFKRNITFLGTEVTFTRDLPVCYDIIYSITESVARCITTISSYIIEFSFYHNFYIIYNKYDVFFINLTYLSYFLTILQSVMAP